MLKKIKALLLIGILLTLVACNSQVQQSGEKVLKLGTVFMYPLDAAQNANGWYTSIYGITETLFVITDDYVVEPLLVKDYTNKDNTWTFTLKDHLVFSNGNPVTADIVVRNLQRAGALNERAVTLAGATYEVLGEHVFSITTNEYNPVLINELTDPFTAIMDIDAIENYDTGIIATGPFMLESYTPESKVVVVRNDQYWGGEVALDKVEIYYIPDSSTLSMSLQNGEIDLYVGPDAEALSVFQANDSYNVTSVAQSRVYMYYVDTQRFSPAVRQAINSAINKEEIAQLLKGLAVPTQGAFGMDTAYGRVSATSYDVSEAKALLEAEGYTLNANGYYEKNGEVLSLEIGYYTARSIDLIVVLMQDQLSKVGIEVTLRNEENPDDTYMKNADCDIAFYSIITNASGDPYAYLSKTLSSQGSLNVFGYANQEVDALLQEMYSETDTQVRASYANQIQQMALEDNAYNFLAILNKVTVAKKGVQNVSEYNPVSYYCIQPDSTVD
jgi:peptide/nickel transport system substrate-binding protein